MKTADMLGVQTVKIPTLNGTLGISEAESNKVIIQAVAHWLAAHKESKIKDVYLHDVGGTFNLKYVFTEIFAEKDGSSIKFYDEEDLEADVVVDLDLEFLEESKINTSMSKGRSEETTKSKKLNNTEEYKTPS